MLGLKTQKLIAAASEWSFQADALFEKDPSRRCCLCLPAELSSSGNELVTEIESTPFIEKSEPNFRKGVESEYSISDRNVLWPVEGRAATRYALHDRPSEAENLSIYGRFRGVWRVSIA
jgi:hypothetical protein